MARAAHPRGHGRGVHGIVARAARSVPCVGIGEMRRDGAAQEPGHGGWRRCCTDGADEARDGSSESPVETAPFAPNDAYAKAGSIAAIVGPRGSGKKTLLYRLLSEAGVKWDGAAALRVHPSTDGWDTITEFIPESCVHESPDVDAISLIFESLKEVKGARVLLLFSDRLIHGLSKEDVYKLMRIFAKPGVQGPTYS